MKALGYNEDEVKAIAAGFQVPGVDQATGEPNMRAGLPTDYFPKPFANDIAARAAPEPEGFGQSRGVQPGQQGRIAPAPRTGGRQQAFFPVGEKADAIERSGASLLLGGDLGCLMNMAGKLKRKGSSVRSFHAAEVLAGMAGGPAIGEER